MEFFFLNARITIDSHWDFSSAVYVLEDLVTTILTLDWFMWKGSMLARGELLKNADFGFKPPLKIIGHGDPTETVSETEGYRVDVLQGTTARPEACRAVSCESQDSSFFYLPHSPIFFYQYANVIRNFLLYIFNSNKVQSYSDFQITQNALIFQF